jgi:small-conductance mechanosensitive channel
MVWVFGMMTLLSHSFNVDCSGIFTGLGASGVVIGFAMQRTIGDAFACATIFLDRPFQVDDWIALEARA